jgi:hypothetical protein
MVQAVGFTCQTKRELEPNGFVDNGRMLQSGRAGVV